MAPLAAQVEADLNELLEIETAEAEDRIARAAEAMAFDPQRLELVEARLFDIRALARKHRVEPGSLPALHRDIAAWVDGLPETGTAEPWIAGAQPVQTIRADPLPSPRCTSPWP